MGWLVITAGVIGLVGLWVVAIYNQLVARRNKVREAWAGIDVQLRRRADLVPALVETVKGYRVHEQNVLQAVTEARTRVTEAPGPHAAGDADQHLEDSLKLLYAVVEAYPDLKASENFLSLQLELAALEEEISFARRYYNALVERFNTAVQRFPTLLAAGPLGFRPEEYFKAEGDDRVAPQAGFG